MKTLKSKLILKGTGLMSNIESVFEITPSSKKGIRFHIAGSTIDAKVENVVATDHCVVLADVENGARAKIALVEHFMAACAISKIDALDVFVTSKGYETPIFDGSAKVWVEEFNKIGFEGDEEEVQPILEPVFFKSNNSSITLIPSDKTTITYMVNFRHNELKQRWVEFSYDKNLGEIIEARTFGYLSDLEGFQKMGFSLGVTSENTVGLTDSGYTTELRSEFEPVKHKILDIIGDLYLTGINPFKMNGNIIVKEAGHKFHVEFAKQVLEASRRNLYV